MARNKNIKEAFLIGLATVGILLTASGCQTDGSSDKDFFPVDSDSAVTKTFDAQAAAGAQADATIYPTHFDGNALNSLGQQKLDLITADLPDSGPVKIYMDTPKDSNVTAEQAKSRKDAIAQYLLNSHLTEEQFKLIDGPNPNLHTLAGHTMADYGKTDTGSASDQTGSDASTAASANAAAH